MSAPRIYSDEERIQRRRESYRNYAKKKYDKDPAAHAKRVNAYRAKNPDFEKKVAKAFRDRHINDPRYTLTARLRTRLRDERKKPNRVAGAETALSLVGCSIPELAKYIESKFKDGMSWENRRLWEIDHILPLAHFDLLDLEQQRKCFHYTNLQPLWKRENRSKGAKLQ